jgi:phenylalanyl-tRNA synthetase alpha subunit
MSHPLEQLRDEALREIESATDEQALETTRVKYLGRSGSISSWGGQITQRDSQRRRRRDRNAQRTIPSTKRIGRARQDRHLTSRNPA